MPSSPIPFQLQSTLAKNHLLNATFTRHLLSAFHHTGKFSGTCAAIKKSQHYLSKLRQKQWISKS